MQRSRRSRAATAAGLMIMVLGATLAFSPSASATDTGDGEHKVTICHRTNSVTNPYVVITVDYAAADGATGKGHNDHTHHDGPPFDFSADPDDAYPTPRNGDQWGDIIPPYDYDNGSFPGKNWTEAGQAIYFGEGSSVECGPPPPEVPTTLQIDKKVEGDDAPATWSFPFTGLSGGFDLTETASSTGALLIDPDTDYVVTETERNGAVDVGIECEGAAQYAIDGDAVTVSVAEGGAATCTFTNTFREPTCEETQSCPPPPCDDDCPPVPCEETQSCPPVPCEETQSCPPVPCEQTQSCPPTLGCVTNCEPPPPPPPLTPCEADPALDACQPCAIDPTLEECAKVESSGGVRTPEPVVEAVQPVAEVVVTPAPVVLDSTVTRTLPRTGTESRDLAMFGFGLVGLGSVMVLRSRRRVRRLF